MKLHTYKDIVEAENSQLEPSYYFSRYIDPSWTGSILDILNMSDCPVECRLYTTLRENFISEKYLRLFAIWCIRQELSMFRQQDMTKDTHFTKRQIIHILRLSGKTCDIAQKYVFGLATRKDVFQSSEKEREASFTKPIFLTNSIWPDSFCMKFYSESSWFGRAYFRQDFFFEHRRALRSKRNFEPFYDSNYLLDTAERYSRKVISGQRFPTEESRQVRESMKVAIIKKVKELINQDLRTNAALKKSG